MPTAVLDGKAKASLIAWNVSINAEHPESPLCFLFLLGGGASISPSLGEGFFASQATPASAMVETVQKQAECVGGATILAEEG